MSMSTWLVVIAGLIDHEYIIKVKVFLPEKMCANASFNNL